MARRGRPQKLPPPWLNRPTYNPPPLTGLTISNPKDTVSRTITDILQPCHEYTFVEPLPDKYVCGICKSVLTEPHVTECCGQHFCKGCLEKLKRTSIGSYRKSSKTCPHCRQSNFNHFQYLPFKREINSLLVHCPRKSSGCNVQVAYADRNNHDETCEYIEINCTNECGEWLLRKDLEHHIENECELRDYECELCGEIGEYREIESSEHRSICPDVIIKCPDSCNVEFKRKEKESHNSICLEAEVDCDFAETGCLETPKRKDLESHMYSHLKQHLSQLMIAHVALKKEFKEFKEKHENEEENVGPPPIDSSDEEYICTQA